MMVFTKWHQSMNMSCNTNTYIKDLRLMRNPEPRALGS